MHFCEKGLRIMQLLLFPGQVSLWSLLSGFTSLIYYATNINLGIAAIFSRNSVSLLLVVNYSRRGEPEGSRRTERVKRVKILGGKKNLQEGPEGATTGRSDDLGREREFRSGLKDCWRCSRNTPGTQGLSHSEAVFKCCYSFHSLILPSFSPSFVMEVHGEHCERRTSL